MSLSLWIGVFFFLTKGDNMTTTNIKSLIMGVAHSVIIPFSLAFGFQNIVFAIIWWAFAFAVYETEAGSRKSGKMVFIVLTSISLSVVILAIIAKGV